MGGNLDLSLLDRTLFISPDADVVLEDRDIVCEVIGLTTWDVYLPLVAEATGRIYTLFCVDFQGGTAADIKINSGDSGNIIYFKTGAAAASFTWDAKNEYSVLYSDGERWFEIGGNR
jgi:hypothetical protein